VYLPRVPDVALNREAPAPIMEITAGSETVLLTEDEDQVRSLARDILEMNGYRVLEANCGEAALEVARNFSERIDLLLTDVVMPGMGGGQLANRLTEMRPGIRVLYMSGYPDDAIVRHGILDANAAFIQKPFSLDGLTKKIRDVLDHESPHESWPAP
jgi:DNA-binding NtrC family response regulator